MINRALGRSNPELPHERIRSYRLLGMQYYARQAFARDHEARSAVYLQAGAKLGRLVTQDGFGNADAVYTFNTAALEVLSAAKQRHLFAVLEQTIAPRALEEELLAEEQQHFPGWEPVRVRGHATEATIEREKQEWELADLILCGSDFVREGIGRCGGAIRKCVVVPYGVDKTFSQFTSPPRKGPLRVLSVGVAGLRKGVAYAYKVAQALDHLAEFRWVGPVALLPGARERVSRYINLTGAVPRSQLLPHFGWADVFFLPSVCEGSATVTYEALMSGLPVVTTPNAGSIVTDGVNGFLVPTGDTNAMVERLQLLHEDRALLSRMQNAAHKSEQIASLEAYQCRLLSALV